MSLHPSVIRPADQAAFSAQKMGKATIFESPRLPHVLEGEGLFLLDGHDLPMRAGDLLVAPEGVPHGIRNTSPGRLIVLAILAPAPHK